ncbi:hypothetical protein Tcan_13801 [Toxocara canis]|uniref:DUF148 domain-containing protein n=1 Tax=Toxocara canis TaxID=6265 RepID=A0A0B2VIU0_TOXCA|nr:hypothetical protein Tcan_13801 [Toxocara canis]
MLEPSNITHYITHNIIFHETLCCIVLSVVLAKDSTEGKMKTGRQMRGPPVPPPFARGASPEELRKLQRIYDDLDQTKRQLNERVEEWVNRQGGQIAKAFRLSQEAMERNHKRWLEKLPAAEIDEELKKTIRSLVELGKDDSLTIRDEMEKVEKLYEALSMEQQETIGEFFLSRD